VYQILWARTLPCGLASACVYRHFRVLRYDSRGHGASTLGVGQYTIDRLVQTSPDCSIIWGSPPHHFAGCPLGGLVGQWLALHAACASPKLVLWQHGAQVGTAESWNARIEAVRQHGIPLFRRPFWIDGFTGPFHQREPRTVDNFGRYLKQRRARAIDNEPAIRDADFRDQSLHRYKALILMGTQTRPHPR